jgi:hypothetical protein
MKSKPVAFLMADLGVTKSHSRPYVSNDNPYSESQFRTMKYRPDFPDRFGCIQDRRVFCQQFFKWYNEEHRHSGIALLTPAVVHFGETQTVLARRQVVLDTAYQTHPDRFVRRPPKPMLLHAGCPKLLDTRRTKGARYSTPNSKAGKTSWPPSAALPESNNVFAYALLLSLATNFLCGAAPALRTPAPPSPRP